MKDIAGHVLLLAFSRIVMQQFSIPAVTPEEVTSNDAVVFSYAQTILELLSLVTVLSCILAAVLPILLPSLPQQSQPTAFSGSLANKQLNSLMVNMQRMFAETVASFVTDVQTRKLVVLLGLCMLPSISAVVSGSSSHKVMDIRSIESFFLASSSTRNKNKKRKGSATSVYANFLAKLWIAGLSMAWMNTTLGFILPSPPVPMASYHNDALGLWMRVISTICLAVLSRSLQQIFPGLDMFQSYIEWSIATSILATMRVSSRNQMTSLSTVFFTGLCFYAVDAFYRDVSSSERIWDMKKNRLKNKGMELAPSDSRRGASFASPLQTLQSVSIIMFTNSLVSWTMETMSAGHAAQGLGQAFATIAGGIVVARTVVQVIDSVQAGQSCQR
jgi:hypothetical protein